MENILTLTLTFKGCWRSMSKREIRQNKNKNQHLEPVIIMSQLVAIFCMSSNAPPHMKDWEGVFCDNTKMAVKETNTLKAFVAIVNNHPVQFSFSVAFTSKHPVTKNSVVRTAIFQIWYIKMTNWSPGSSSFPIWRQ